MPAGESPGSFPGQTVLAPLLPRRPSLSLLRAFPDSPGPEALLSLALYTLLALCSGAVYLVLWVSVKVSFLCSFSRTSQANFTHSCFVQSILIETKRKEVCIKVCIRKQLTFSVFF